MEKHFQVLDFLVLNLFNNYLLKCSVLDVNLPENLKPISHPSQLGTLALARNDFLYFCNTRYFLATNRCPVLAIHRDRMRFEFSIVLLAA